MSQRTLQESLVSSFGVRLARVEAFLGLTADSDGEAPQIRAYNEYVDEYLPPFLSACKQLGDSALELDRLLEKAFIAQRSFLFQASQCRRPQTIRPADFDSLLEVQSCIEEISKIRDNRSEFTNHQNMVYEAVQALGWLCVERTPKPAVDSFVEGLDFWGNKIRVKYKTSSLDHIAFVETLKSLLSHLAEYIKDYHLVGVTWNPKGGDVTNYTPGAASPAKAASPAAGGMANVFAGIKSIDQSSGKTAGLKKVTKDMQTWRKDYKPEGATPTPAAPAAAKKPATPVKITKPAVCEERNGNWQIEYQTGPEPLTVSGINMKQQVYIFGCEGATILLEGKAKNIVFDSCKKTKLIFDNAVSSIEIVNCKGVQVQCKGVVPSVAIDKTDGCLVYISWEGREVQFVTSKSSEMNVAFPQGAGSDDYVEKPIPEQFVHKITDDLSISSDVSSLYSH
ncbi:Adenylyl cyclase-associated protein [Phytophthora nicotianae]|uniref:Adenylyl cyclase-associated protein n=1 Tax=Phytophthora nicotianae TaxID=4792 RepID=A0A0W8CGD0_PHYNI|nr:Adenylyl cyclase-associated protein [Phytophthora nicotianae]